MEGFTMVVGRPVRVRVDGRRDPSRFLVIVDNEALGRIYAVRVDDSGRFFEAVEKAREAVAKLAERGIRAPLHIDFPHPYSLGHGVELREAPSP